MRVGGAAAAAARGEAAAARRLVAGDGGGGDHNESLGEWLMHLCLSRRGSKVSQNGSLAYEPSASKTVARGVVVDKINRKLHRLRGANHVWL